MTNPVKHTHIQLKEIFQLLGELPHFVSILENGSYALLNTITKDRIRYSENASSLDMIILHMPSSLKISGVESCTKLLISEIKRALDEGYQIQFSDEIDLPPLASKFYIEYHLAMEAGNTPKKRLKTRTL